jgi:hypothetical protein
MVGKSAKDMHQYLRSQGISKNPQVIFDIILRSKFGIQDCSARKRGNMFPQMKLYADGYHQVLSWLAQGHTLEELFVGKVHINDLPYLD